MNNLKEFYQFLLKEQGVVKPEAPPSADMGQYAFAPARLDTPKPKEPNTAVEEKILRALNLYIVTNTKNKLEDVLPTIMKLRKLGYYRSILDPSAYSTVYRFLSLTKESLAKIVGVSEITKPTGSFGPGVLTSHDSNISGWTATPGNFADWGTTNEYVAVFIASVGKNQFFGNPGKLATAIGAGEKYIKEMETIAIGPVKYDKCFYTFNSEPPEPPFDVPSLLKQAGIG